ncbi:MAG: InlB B-repeat-containing protein, partial [Anaeroplasmataceae bacterium]|nr:InlB B-repeat-containing protein [Anaeroplasmataceae bacterium]
MKKLIFFFVLCFMSIACIGCNNQTKAYTITFELHGHGSQPEELSKITELPELPSLQEEGYHFIGWYLDEAFLEEAKAGMQVDEDKTLHALWEKLYRVDFEINGHGTKPDAIKDVTKLPKLNDLQEEGFIFMGWYLDKELTQKAEDGIVLHEDIQVYAKWEEIIKTYEVTFENNGHGATQQKLTELTQLPEPLPALTEDGYQFDGWYLDEKLETPATPKLILEKDTTLYAKWTKLYHIHFETNGHGETVSDIRNVLALPNEFPVLEEMGYIFDGWFLDEKLETPAVVQMALENDIMLYAKWTELYDIHYEINGHGEAIEEILDVLVLPGKLPVLEEEGYEFDGWYLDEDFTIPAVENAVLKKDTTLYAKWELEGYHYVEKLDEATKKNLSVDGYAQTGITDFTQYYNTSAYRKVSTPLEFLTALVDAKYEYTNTWNEETKTVEQALTKEGSVHV